MINQLKKDFNTRHKEVRKLLTKKTTFDKGIELLRIHYDSVHLSSLDLTNPLTIEDYLWNELSEDTFRFATNKKGRTIAYGLYHCTRIEDICINALINEDAQVINTNNWLKKLNCNIYDTGNSLSKDEILEFSKSIDMLALKEYRFEVAKKTRKLIDSISYEKSKALPSEISLNNLIENASVLDNDDCKWLIDFWRKKTVTGTFLMQCTRHHLIHLNESFEAKYRNII